MSELRVLFLRFLGDAVGVDRDWDGWSCCSPVLALAEEARLALLMLAALDEAADDRNLDFSTSSSASAFIRASRREPLGLPSPTELRLALRRFRGDASFSELD